MQANYIQKTTKNTFYTTSIVVIILYMNKNSGESEPVNVRMTPKAKEKLQLVTKTFGMTQVELAGRLLNWFVFQEKTLQAIILDLVGDQDSIEVLGLIHKRLAEKIVTKHIPPGTGKTLAQQRKSSRGGKEKG